MTPPAPSSRSRPDDRPALPFDARQNTAVTRFPGREAFLLAYQRTLGPGR